MRRSAFIPVGLVLLLWALSDCSRKLPVNEQLSRIDELLQSDPKKAWDSFSAVDPLRLSNPEIAYYNLLLTIAQHKNRIPFSSDSLISVSRAWYGSHGDSYNYARACFYHGLVIWLSGGDHATACEVMLQALKIMADNQISDDRLEALVCAYLGQVNDYYAFNLPEAATYYRRAVALEKRMKNERNLISNYCSLLACYVKMGEAELAREALATLDSLETLSPKIRLEKAKNAKALYYLHTVSELDSALFYGLAWNPVPEERGAKEQILAEINRRNGLWEQAIAHEKAALNHRRSSDSLSFHVYYHSLAEFYGHLGNADSTAHYASIAYEALRESVLRKTEKRVLELERRYDLASKESELERIRHHRNLLGLILGASLLLTGGLFVLLWSRGQKLRAERITRSILQASAKTHQFTLASLKPMAVRRKSVTATELQESIAHLATDLRKGFSENFWIAIESSRGALTSRQWKELQKLPGKRAKTVYILTELGYGEEEIAEYTCTSVDSVRVTINNNKKNAISPQ